MGLIIANVFFYSLTHNNIIYPFQNFAPMKFSELKDELFKNYESGNISDTQLVQIIEQASEYLNLKTATETAKYQKKSYNGIAKIKKVNCVVGSVNFYINNE